MLALAIILSGYSIFGALVIGLTHFRRVNYSGQAFTQYIGIALLLVLAGLQYQHFVYLYYHLPVVSGPLYRILLFAVAPVFYLFSRPLLFGAARFKPWQAIHFAPPIFAPFLDFNWALPLAFAIGALYLLWLTRCVYALRAQRSRFRREFILLTVVFFIALIVLVLGFNRTTIGETLFYELYASAIGCAFVLVNLALGFAPHLADEVSEAARETYAVSTLNQVDSAAILQQLTVLMESEQLYRQPDLDLAGLATRVGLSTHQLSELINTRLGKGFSRYLREYRVAAAKQSLLSERSASVLSIGLSVGFTSQSNFYDAFREIAGMTPGQYRKIHTEVSPER